MCKVSGANWETIGFVRILGWFEGLSFSYNLDLVCCFCGASETYSETFGFVRSLGLFIFFPFDLLFLRSKRGERSLLGNFWVCSNSGFVRSLGLFVFLDLVCCFCGASEASGVYLETFWFV